MAQRDAIYAAPRDAVAGFTFDEAVVTVFPDMIKRSIPGYAQMIAYLGVWAARYVQPHSRVYDLGCSLGASTFAARERITQADVQMVAVDNSAAMIAQCRENLRQRDSDIPVDLVEADLQDVPIENASLVMLNFTLQFIAPDERDDIIQTIYDGLNPGGVLILSEKVVFPTGEQTERFIDIYHDFKRANGYSELEVAQKRTALENVLIPETIEQNRARLLRAGFASAETWFQAFNFMSMVGIKE